MDLTAPIKFTPYFKTVIWGGDNICRYKGIPQPEPRIGESWEISAIEGHESVVADGPFRGATLTQLVDRFGAELLGDKVVKKFGKRFPLLVKIIDANDNLSVQVHPDDELAARRHNSFGKTEMWYIIAAGKGAEIFAGLKTPMTPDDYVRRVSDGTFVDALAVHESSPGDVFFLPAGRVHAIGAGNLLAEIQESSDITYRIYDYDRRDARGNARELHTDLAKDAIDFTVLPDYKSPRPAESDTEAEIVACDHFNVTRVILDGEKSMTFNRDSFTILMCVDGEVAIDHHDGPTTVAKGSTVLIPAALASLNLRGKATMLIARV